MWYGTERHQCEELLYGLRSELALLSQGGDSRNGGERMDSRDLSK
jgi:hypothetical protein